MIYKFNFDDRSFKDFAKTLNLPVLILTSISLISVGIIWYLFSYKYSSLTPHKNSINILFIILICFVVLVMLYRVFYGLLFISIFKKLMPLNNETQVATLNSDCLIISSKGLERKYFLNEIISADFKDNEINIKMDNEVVIIPLYFENGEEFSDLLYEYI